MLQAGVVCAGQPVRRRRRRQHAAAFCLRGVLRQDRSRSDRQPASCGEKVCQQIRRAAIGSPQPPPGGGLQFASRRSARASPSARLRVARTTLMLTSLGYASKQIRCRRHRRAAASRRRRPAARVLQVRFARSFAGCSPRWNVHYTR